MTYRTMCHRDIICSSTVTGPCRLGLTRYSRDGRMQSRKVCPSGMRITGAIIAKSIGFDTWFRGPQRPPTSFSPISDTKRLCSHSPGSENKSFAQKDITRSHFPSGGVAYNGCQIRDFPVHWSLARDNRPAGVWTYPHRDKTWFSHTLPQAYPH